MKESVGYTVTLNIIIMFLIIVFTFLSAALIYFKSNKVSNVITNSIEKYEGYNSYAIKEINLNLASLGYNKFKINCKDTAKSGSVSCSIVHSESQENGYCVYECNEGDYYYYRIKTNMMLNIPIINDILNIPIFSNTNRLYDFEKVLG